MKRITLKIYASEFTFMADDAEAKRFGDAMDDFQRLQQMRDNSYDEYVRLNRTIIETGDMKALIEDFNVRNLAEAVGQR